MAKSKENQTQAPEETAKAPAPELNKTDDELNTTAPELNNPAPDGPVAAQEQAAPESNDPAPEQTPEPALYTLEELINQNRIPGWQAAALHKMMGWEAGKKVSAAEYALGLARLKNRRIGG
jgi:hypothetical protein